jgi:hypothetical protein
MYSALNDAALPASGLPIRRSAGQCLFSDSPRLIAAVHVLLRLLVPRHPPCALTILTVSSTHAEASVGRIPFGPPARGGPIFGLGAVFKLRRGRLAGASRRRSLKTEQRIAAAEAAAPLHGATRRAKVRSTSRECLPRKEVIQPQLPLRLPCYDFTPITSPTFDGSLPKGLGHRLRVLPAFVV